MFDCISLCRIGLKADFEFSNRIFWNSGCFLEEEILALVGVRFACPHLVAVAVDKNAFAYCIDFTKIASIMHCAHLGSLSLLQVSAALMVRGQTWFGCSSACPAGAALLVQVQTGMS